MKKMIYVLLSLVGCFSTGKDSGDGCTSDVVWEVRQETYWTYLNGANQLSKAQCEKICQDFYRMNNNGQSVFDIEDCENLGVDSDGNQLIACEQSNCF